MSVPSHKKQLPISSNIKLIIDKSTHPTSTHTTINSHNDSNITSLSPDLSNMNIIQPYLNFQVLSSSKSNYSLTLADTQGSGYSHLRKLKLLDLQTLLRLKAKSVNADAINKEQDKARTIRYKEAEVFIRKQEDDLLKQQVQDWDSLYHQDEVSVNKTPKDSTFSGQNSTVIELPRGVPKLPMQPIRKSSVEKHYTDDLQVNTATRRSDSKPQVFVSENSSDSQSVLIENITDPQSNIVTLNGSKLARSVSNTGPTVSSSPQPDRPKPKSKQIVRQAQLQGFELWVTTQCQLTDPVFRANSLQSLILFAHYTKWSQQPAQKDIIAITSDSDFGRLMNKRLPGRRYEKSKASYYSGIILK